MATERASAACSLLDHDAGLYIYKLLRTKQQTIQNLIESLLGINDMVNGSHKSEVDMKGIRFPFLLMWRCCNQGA